jgi:hypothetical protein
VVSADGLARIREVVGAEIAVNWRVIRTFVSPHAEERVVWGNRAVKR